MIKKKKNPYDGKYFYEVVNTKEPGKLELYGPLDNIRFMNPKNGKLPAQYKYVQVVNGRMVAAFTKNEIIVTKSPLMGKI